jgi:hypothetical protein
MKRGTQRVTHRPYQPSYYHAEAQYALSLLQSALIHAKAAGAPCTVARIRFAISSARGAVRNASYRVRP